VVNSGPKSRGRPSQSRAEAQQAARQIAMEVGIALPALENQIATEQKENS
jgi:hypothetical protein